MKTAIRLDDITPDMDFDKFNRAREIFKRHSIRPLIGVVPFNRDANLCKSVPDGNFKEFLKELTDDGYTVALHGYNHLYTTKKKGLFPLNNFSEFAGVPYEKQREMLVKGMDKLNEWGIETDIFMAPAHTFDKNTIKALKTVGVKKITDGFGNWPYERNRVVFYPIAKQKKDCISNKEGYTTLVLHTNMMDDKDFDNLETMIEKNRGHFIDYREYLREPHSKQNIIARIMEYAMAYLKYLIVKAR